MRAPVSHQCGPGLIPGSIPVLAVMCRLSLLLVLFSVRRGFSPGSLVFPSPQKPTIPNFNSIWIVSLISTVQLIYLRKIEQVEIQGVTEVTWVDDCSVAVRLPQSPFSCSLRSWGKRTFLACNA